MTGEPFCFDHSPENGTNKKDVCMVMDNQDVITLRVE